MNKLELQAFEYAVHVFNEILELSNQDYSFEIVWNTKFGPSYANNIIYSSERTPIMEINFNDNYGGYNYKTFDVGCYKDDFLAFVRYNVFKYFENSFDNGFSEKLQIVEQPYYLMNKLLELSKMESNNELKKPSYSSVWNFKTLDGSIELPFINDDSLIEYPISLLKK